MDKISELIDQGYNFISMDTEFPGIIYHQQFDYNTMPDQGYQFLKKNVDALQVI